MSNSLNQSNSTLGAAAAPQTANETDADISAILSEKFQIVRELTKTDACSIYLARDLRHLADSNPDADSLVRLKVLSRQMAGDRRQVELFRLEASAAASLSHKNIVKSEKAKEAHGVHFCVIEQRPGVITLSDHLKKKGWLNADEAVRISQQIADAFEYAHSHGVLHLALKPEDVLLDEEGTVFITGFGIDRAKELLWARQERSHHCAARYISPEQVVSADVDQRSDLYLLGLLLYEMLTDRAPFESGDEASLRLKHLTRTPEPPHTFRQELSRALSQIVMDLLAKRPDGRPFCASALKSALERCVASGLIADEEIEEDEGLEQSIDYAPLRLMVAEDLPDRAYTREENQDSSELAMQDGETAGFEVDEPATLDRIVVPDAKFQDPFPAYQTGFINDGYEASDLEAEYEPVAGDSTQMASLARALPEADEYGPSESLIPLQRLPSKESSNKRARRLTWLVILALFGAGLFWEMRAARFHRTKPELAQVSPVAESQSSNETAASSDEITVPTPEITIPMKAEELSSASEPTIAASDNGSFDHKKDLDAATQKKQAEETTAEKSPLPEQSRTAPPVLPVMELDGAAAHDPPAESFKEKLNDAQPQEPAPAPEQPVKAQAPALKVIRKSGDVLQNTAIIRPRPIYPKAARAAGIKGGVTVEVTIDEDGGVLTARPISGPEQLQEAAVAAARQWKWVPERVDRGRARVMGTITFNFRD